MTEIGKYIQLMSIVSMYLDQYQKSQADRDRIWVLAFRALYNLNFNIAAEPKTLMLAVSPNKTVAFPPDLISWTKIGVADNEGKICSIKVNKALTNWKSESPNRLNSLAQSDVQTFDYLTNQVGLFYNYYGDNQYGNLYGVGDTLIQYGECSVDDKNNVIIFAPNFPYSSILLEYISSPQKDGDYKVLTVLQEAIIAFIEWKTLKGSRENYYAAALEARRAIGKNRVTLQGINQLIRENNGMFLRS